MYITHDTGFDQATIRYYSDEAPTYFASGRGGRNRFIDRFMNQLRPGSRVLDLGCGGAIDAAAMVDFGFDVDAIEGSPSLAALASTKLGREVLHLRFDELSVVETYDAIWASASLIHVPRSALTGVLAKVYRALKPGGFHFATYKAGGMEGRDRVGRYYNYPNAGELQDFYPNPGSWEIEEVIEYIGGGFETGSGPWLAIQTKRNNA